VSLAEPVTLGVVQGATEFLPISSSAHLRIAGELKNALRAGDVSVPGSRQFKDFEEYLLRRERFAELRDAQALPVAIEVDGETYLRTRLALLKEKLLRVDQLASDGQLTDAEITGELLKVSPLKKSVPEEAEQLEDEAFATMPHLRITELLLEVDQWVEFTRHFTHLRSDDLARDRSLLLTVILADAINLGLAKMAEACPGATFYFASLARPRGDLLQGPRRNRKLSALERKSGSAS
jgi:Tn3 transposase DDE domain/Bacitracin resistance protein BacA